MKFTFKSGNKIILQDNLCRRRSSFQIIVFLFSDLKLVLMVSFLFFEDENENENEND